MSARYRPVQWTAVKLGYDAVVLAAVALYVLAYEYGSRALFRGARAPSPAIVDMRAWGSCAFVLLTLTLALGPLARLDRRFLPLLYNRRHLGVAMCAVALQHAVSVLGFYFAWGKEPTVLALLQYDGASPSSLPFLAFGISALAILVVMAATSHDFWQKFFGATAWKSLHMLVYLAYGLSVLHVAFGALQRGDQWGVTVMMIALSLALAALHVVAASRSRALDTSTAAASADGWLDVGEVDDLPDGHARGFCPREGERIALVHRAGKLYALHGSCAHQRGPLAEGRVLEGCLTCPWHGWQYRVEDGRSPPPFEELIPTYRLRRLGARVQVDPRPLPLGSAPQPLPLGRAAERAGGGS